MIRRYYAVKDNTITNAFEENLTTRGTGSNMGASDILETFSIYAQASSSSGFSSELARILIEFDTVDIASDRTAGTVPESGSVSWFLKMYDAPHSQTVPSNFTLEISAVSGSWEEGYGIDMDFYEDLTKDGVGSNWINANGTIAAATATLDITNDITLTSVADGVARNLNTFKLVVNAAAANPTNTILATFAGTSTAITGTITPNDGTNNGSTAVNLTTEELVELINSGSVTGKTVTVTDTPSLRALQTAAGGGSQNLANGGEGHNVVGIFKNGSGRWATAGGDYYTDTSSSFTQVFSSGLEDLSVDVTTLVEQWLNSAGNILGPKDNHGFGIKLAAAAESQSKSFFTKKFFGRDTEYHYQRPVLEARWNSARQDDRGSFYTSSSLAPAEDNLNTIYLYNSIRGRLRNIPGIDTGTIGVSIFSSSANGPTGPALKMSVNEPNIFASNLMVVTGGYVSTGIYSASIAFTGSNSLTDIHDVWFKLDNTVSDATTAATQYATGAIGLKSFASQGNNPETSYVLNMPRLKKEYKRKQTHRLDLYVREKDWSPNIYTRAVRSSIPSLTIPSASFQLRRCIDDYVVVPYGTGSTSHTGLSYDVSGNYFDLDTTYLETGYLYEIQYSFYDEENGWEEQPYRFKFRVVD